MLGDLVCKKGQVSEGELMPDLASVCPVEKNEASEHSRRLREMQLKAPKSVKIKGLIS